MLPLGGLLGGAWTFLAAIATPLLLVLLDLAIGGERTGQAFQAGRHLRWLPRIYILLQLLATMWAAAWIARGTRAIELFGMIASTGVTAGVFGFLAAHEMVHSRKAGDQALGALFLASVFYLHFRIAHIFGHHRRAATADDPATARSGESLYAFLARSIRGQLGDAWQHERRRLRRSGRRAFAPGNRMIVYFAVELSIIAAVALTSGRALIFLIGQAILAVVLLESFNYISHYGLVRRRQIDGALEPLQAHHSWNSIRWMNNAALFNMGCHSDHHRHPCRPFGTLNSVAEEAELPSGYAAAVIMAFVPPIWRSAMDPRVRSVMEAH